MPFSKYIKDKRNIMIIFMIALYNFVFLGTEYFFDNVCAVFVEESQVVLSQNIVLGVSAVGFVLYGFLIKWLGSRLVKIMELISVFLYIVGIAILNEAKGYAVALFSGCCIFLLLGIMGAKICYFASNRISDLKYLARTVGIGYAFGILLQFVNNNLVCGNAVQSAALAAGIVLLYILAGKVESVPERDYTNERQKMKSVKWSAALLVIVTVLLTLIFSTLDNAVTLVHASGEFDIGQWPRLILAFSGILSGIIYDIKERRYMAFAMYTITLLSVICIVIIELGGSFVWGLMMFYISAGFFVVFFMTAFMEVSYYTAMPRVWAGLGRGVNNISAFATTAISISLLNEESPMLILIVALFLFVFISAAMLMYYSFSRAYEVNNNSDSGRGGKVSLSSKPMGEQAYESRFVRFGKMYSFTEREIECLEALVSINGSVQEIAVSLSISRAALYRHIASMNEKSNTKDRKQLIRLYYESENLE